MKRFYNMGSRFQGDDRGLEREREREKEREQERCSLLFSRVVLAGSMLARSGRPVPDVPGPPGFNFDTIQRHASRLHHHHLASQNFFFILRIKNNTLLLIKIELFVLERIDWEDFWKTWRYEKIRGREYRELIKLYFYTFFFLFKWIQ